MDRRTLTLAERWQAVSMS